MSEYVGEDGEVIQDQEPAEPRSPFHIAKSELAAFKFKLHETVAADPKLRKAPCTEAIIAYARCLTIDKRTLKPTPVYASTTTLMARGKMKSKTTARLARKLLQQEGYLVPTGSSTKDGCVWYQLANPRAEQVEMHVREAEEYLGQIDAARKEDERKKKRAKECHGEQYTVPPEGEEGVKFWPDRGSNIDPNYLGVNLSSLGNEEGGPPIKVSTAPSNLNLYAQVDEVDDVPFDIPSTEAEAEHLFQAICSGQPPVTMPVLQFWRGQLAAGKLTPNLIRAYFRSAA